MDHTLVSAHTVDGNGPHRPNQAGANLASIGGGDHFGAHSILKVGRSRAKMLTRQVPVIVAASILQFYGNENDPCHHFDTVNCIEMMT